MLCNHIRNCIKVKKGSLFSVRVLALKPRAGGLWAYGFAVLYFCKIFPVRGPQAGADERGFRDFTLSVGELIILGPKAQLSCLNSDFLLNLYWL